MSIRWISGSGGGGGGGGMTPLQVEKLETLVTLSGGWLDQPPVISWAPDNPIINDVRVELVFNVDDVSCASEYMAEYQQGQVILACVVDIDWGDGNSETFEKPSSLVFNHTYDEPGEYTIQVVLTHQGGESNTLTAEVTATAP